MTSLPPESGAAPADETPRNAGADGEKAEQGPAAKKLRAPAYVMRLIQAMIDDCKGLITKKDWQKELREAGILAYVGKEAQVRHRTQDRQESIISSAVRMAMQDVINSLLHEQRGDVTPGPYKRPKDDTAVMRLRTKQDRWHRPRHNHTDYEAKD